MQDFPNSIKEKGEMGNLSSFHHSVLSSVGGKLRRSDFDHSHLFQSKSNIL